MEVETECSTMSMARVIAIAGARRTLCTLCNQTFSRVPIVIPSSFHDDVVRHRGASRRARAMIPAWTLLRLGETRTWLPSCVLQALLLHKAVHARSVPSPPAGLQAGRLMPTWRNVLYDRPTPSATVMIGQTPDRLPCKTPAATQRLHETMTDTNTWSVNQHFFTVWLVRTQSAEVVCVRWLKVGQIYEFRCKKVWFPGLRLLRRKLTNLPGSLSSMKVPRAALRQKSSARKG